MLESYWPIAKLTRNVIRRIINGGWLLEPICALSPLYLYGILVADFFVQAVDPEIDEDV
jgi:hypothetical protein